MFFPFGLGDVPALPAIAALPVAGDAAALKTFLTELGGTFETVGTETVEGVELVHLKGGVNIVNLVQSQRFLSMTGMTRDQVAGIADMEGKIGISTEIWVNKASGRLATLRIEGKSIESPVATVTVMLRIAEPGPEISFEAPASFTTVDVSELVGNQLPGFGVGGGGVAEPVATTAPATE